MGTSSEVPSSKPGISVGVQARGRGEDGEGQLWGANELEGRREERTVEVHDRIGFGVVAYIRGL